MKAQPCGCRAARLEPLIAGYQRFRATEWPRERERFELTAEQGQRPHSLVIACSDSRVDPQMIFGAGPGELFVIRNVASLVPPFEQDEAHHGTSAAIEFAVRILEVGRILVLGHEMCGGIGMLLQAGEAGELDFAGRWMNLAAAARRAGDGLASPEARRTACEQAAVRLSLANLLTFPWVAEAVRQGKLSLHGGYFDIHRARLLVLGDHDEFVAAEAL